jgi:hypothetical protein
MAVAGAGEGIELEVELELESEARMFFMRTRVLQSELLSLHALSPVAAAGRELGAVVEEEETRNACSPQGAAALAADGLALEAREAGD